jgi:small-conductance mechanosensitive channel
MNSKSIVNIIKDDEQLTSYIESLEEELKKTENIDEQVDMILSNILKLFNNFNDRRALRASNIDAIANLIKLKSEIPMKRIQTKKIILDMLTKKKELEIKEKNANATSNLANTTSDMLKAIYQQLDNNNIHPIIEATLEETCKDIIDTPQLEADEFEFVENNGNEEVIDVVKLQKSVDESTIEIEESGDDISG